MQLQTYLKIQDKKIIHPFGHKSSSISAFLYNQFAFYIPKDQNLFATKFGERIIVPLDRHFVILPGVPV